MKRKLIQYDAFKKIEEGSLSTAQFELMEAENVLASTLGVDDVKLHCFGESDVTYKTLDGTFIHATYTLDKNKLALENIEELVIEQESEKKKAREVLNSMVESLLDSNDQKASSEFATYLSLSVVRRDLLVSEGVKTAITVSKPTGSLSPLAHKHQPAGLVAKRTRARNKTLKRLANSSGLKKNRAEKRDVASNKLGQTSSKRARVYMRTVKPAKMKEWANLSENVVDFINYKEVGPVMRDSAVATDDRGNVTAVAVPTSLRRNEGKILTFNWNTLDHEVKVLRSNVKKVNEDVQFVKAIADLKRYNGISDNNALEETIESIVAKWPDLLYLSQTELAQKIAEALEIAGVQSWDDQICDFMAEGILRMAHHAYADRVKKIGSVAGVDLTTEIQQDKDNYAEFQAVVHKFYPTLDESDDSEMRVFSDLYKALHEVYRLAGQSGDEATKAEVSNFMSECQSVLNRDIQPDLNLAEAIANFLYDLAETNLGLGSTWDVTNTTHPTINGDHPAMAEKARKGYTPSADFSSDWPDEAPVSDGKSYRNGLADEMRNRSWGNHGGDGTYPSLKNPYVPAPFGDYTMKGEKGAEKDGTDDWSRWQSGDTWPSLQNPYVPKAVTPQSYKMKSDNLIVDK